MTAVIDVSSRAGEFRRTVRVVYDSAVAVLRDGYAESIKVLITHPGYEPTNESIAISDAMPLLLELDDFVKHLEGRPPPRSSAAIGALIVERIEELRALAGI